MTRIIEDPEWATGLERSIWRQVLAQGNLEPVPPKNPG